MKKFLKNHKKEETELIENQDGLELVSLDNTTSPALNKGRKKREKAVLTPAQKKKRRKKIIMGAVAACLALFIVSRMLTPAPLPVVTVRGAETATI